jgi:RimJ/RimL family protein N-acetyltransferase
MDGLGIPALETERLRLRALRGSDFEDCAALYGDPEVVRFIGTGAAAAPLHVPARRAG